MESVFDLIALDLNDVFAQLGWAVCRLRLGVEKHYLEGFLYESVNDPGMRGQLAQSLGFCYEHATQLRKLQAISRSLTEYLRKQNWNYHDEPKLPEEFEARRTDVLG